MSEEEDFSEDSIEEVTEPKTIEEIIDARLHYLRSAVDSGKASIALADPSMTEEKVVELSRFELRLKDLERFRKDIEELVNTHTEVLVPSETLLDKCLVLCKTHPDPEARVVVVAKWIEKELEERKLEEESLERKALHLTGRGSLLVDNYKRTGRCVIEIDPIDIDIDADQARTITKFMTGLPGPLGTRFTKFYNESLKIATTNKEVLGHELTADEIANFIEVNGFETSLTNSTDWGHMEQIHIVLEAVNAHAFREAGITASESPKTYDRGDGMTEREKVQSMHIKLSTGRTLDISYDLKDQERICKFTPLLVYRNTPGSFGVMGLSEDDAELISRSVRRFDGEFGRLLKNLWQKCCDQEIDKWQGELTAEKKHVYAEEINHLKIQILDHSNPRRDMLMVAVAIQTSAKRAVEEQKLSVPKEKLN